MFHKAFTALAEVFSDTARRKREAAIARETGTDPTAEPPAVVYDRSCAQVAAAFAQEGYRYAKSGPHLTKKEGAFTYQIHFQTSHHNIAGQHVMLSVAANVRCRQLAEWRKSQPAARRQGDWLAGGLIHLLGTDLAYITWDLADASLRPQTIDDVVSTLRKIVLPYFDRFKEPSRLVAQLEAADVPALGISDAVECALSFAGRTSAERILRRYVSAHPEFTMAIQEAEQKILSEGLDKFAVKTYADQVAYLRAVYKLDR